MPMPTGRLIVPRCQQFGMKLADVVYEFRGIGRVNVHPGNRRVPQREDTSQAQQHHYGLVHIVCRHFCCHLIVSNICVDCSYDAITGIEAASMTVQQSDYWFASSKLE